MPRDREGLRAVRLVRFEVLAFVVLLVTRRLGSRNTDSRHGKVHGHHDRPTPAPKATRSSSSCAKVSGIALSIPALASSASFEG